MVNPLLPLYENITRILELRTGVTDLPAGRQGTFLRSDGRNEVEFLLSVPFLYFRLSDEGCASAFCLLRIKKFLNALRASVVSSGSRRVLIEPTL